MQDVPEGFDLDAVETWLSARIPTLTTPLGVELIEGGRSNLTYAVTDAAEQRYVLRRPPLHGVIQSAHDVAREHRIISALAATSVPVPACVGLEDDSSVTGAPFYVMHHVEGHVIRDADAALALTRDARQAASDDLVDVLARLHDVDVDAVGLGSLAKREDYIGRQLRRWHGQLQQVRTRDLTLLDELHDRLVRDIPAQGPATIVHGDYRLDNVIVSDEGRVQAVLDWELCTLGDPMADLGLLMVYWSQPGDETIPLLDAPTTVAGFPSRTEVAARYAERSGRDLSELGYYVAFGYWKLAIILEGVYSRFRSGAYGESNEEVAVFAEVVLQLAKRADEAAQEVGR